MATIARVRTPRATSLPGPRQAENHAPSGGAGSRRRRSGLAAHACSSSLLDQRDTALRIGPRQMPTDARRIRQHPGAEIPARSDAGAADRTTEHRKHLMESREALRCPGQLVIEFEILAFGRDAHL